MSTKSEGQVLDRREWAEFFEGINRRLMDGAPFEATIEVVSDPIDGTEAERLPLNAITYEDGDDEIAIGLGGRGKRFPAVLWHFVDHPREVSVVGEAAMPRGIVIESEDDTLTVVRLYPEGEA
jgi:uncharacterized protein DUF5335